MTKTKNFCEFTEARGFDDAVVAVHRKINMAFKEPNWLITAMLGLHVWIGL